ncbi:hypothetical protein ACEZDB_26890 [Streptacidiphilus sp. N1-3]|uniref:Uncharacterized protein n=1 Tax=Streptacidiphilus alkalitolerans TaxID=3342712 RepID=A0ABV6X7L6_9ACTN
MSSTERSTDLGAAVGAQLATQQAAAAAASAPARQQYADGIAADAKLYGTPAWEALSPQRRAVVAHHTRAAAQPTTEAGAEQ